MNDEDPDNESFETRLRRFAEQVTRSVEDLDLDQIARVTGVDPSRARDLLDEAQQWFSEHAEGLASEVASRFGGATHSVVDNEPAPSGTRPHPLDMPTSAQGLALSAIDSGRWAIEPGSHKLSALGDGPAPADALGLVGELRARDWINAHSELTLVGREALRRWMEHSATPPQH